MSKDKEVTKRIHVLVLTSILWVVNLKLFLFLSNYSQVAQIWKYSENIIDFYDQTFSYFYDFVITIPPLTTLITSVFAISLFVFWYYYFQVYFHKLPKQSTLVMSVWGIFPTFISFLGFGCVACGQTLITSIVFLFISNTSAYLAHLIGNSVLIIGLLFLTYGTYRNYKIYHNKNICKI